MGYVRWRVISLLIWLTLFFNLERLDLGGVDTINLPTGIYLIGIATAIAALTPFFQQRSLWMLIAMAVASYLGALLVTLQPLLGGVHTYLTFTGLFLLVVTAVLAYNLGQSLREFLAAVEEMTFSHKGGRLRSESEAQELIKLEMLSSRRTQRPLSLVVLQGDASSMNMMLHRLIREIQRSMMQRYLMATVARVLARYLRRTDIIIEGQQAGRFMLLAPETSTEHAVALGERLRRIAHERLGLDANYSVATFPDQALTYEELLNVADQQLNEQVAGKNGSLEPEEQLYQRAEQPAQEPLAVAVGQTEPQAYEVGAAGQDGQVHVHAD